MDMMSRLTHRGGAAGLAGDRESVLGEFPLDAFEYFPFGIVLLDESGMLLAANREAATLLEDEALADGDRRPPVRCCDLLRCGDPDGPPQRRCITELALEVGGRLPEVRIDAASGVAVWVTAAPMPGGVILNLRPGMLGDRRRRTEPHWISGPMLRIHTFGTTKVSSGESSLDGIWLEHRTGKLLKYLVTARGEHMHAEQIAAALWPNAGPEALGALRQCVHALRQRLEPKRSKHEPPSFVLARNGGYELNAPRVWIDADEFENCARAGLSALRNGDARAALAHLGAALELYQGDFLGDEPYAEWAFAERDRLRDLAGQVLRTVSDLHLSSGEVDLAAEHLQRLTQVDPFDVDVQRRLIGLYIGAGRRSQAVRRYERLRQQMLNAFGEKLDFELSDVSREAHSAHASD